MKKILAIALMITSIYSAHFNHIRINLTNHFKRSLPKQMSEIYTMRLDFLLNKNQQKVYEAIFLEKTGLQLQRIAVNHNLTKIKFDREFPNQDIQPLNKLAKEYAQIIVNRKLTVEQVYCDVKEVYKKQGKTIAALLQMQKHQEPTPVSNKEINICNVEWDDCGFFFDVRDSSGAKIDLKK